MAGVNNTAVGASALVHNSNNNNTALGYQALFWNATGNSNTAVGFNAGFNVSTRLTGCQNMTLIGATTNATSDGLSNSTALGYGAIITASNQIMLGNTDVTEVVTAGNIQAGSFTTTTDGSVSTTTLNVVTIYEPDGYWAYGTDGLFFASNKLIQWASGDNWDSTPWDLTLGRTDVSELTIGNGDSGLGDLVVRDIGSSGTYTISNSDGTATLSVATSEMFLATEANMNIVTENGDYIDLGIDTNPVYLVTESGENIITETGSDLGIGQPPTDGFEITSATITPYNGGYGVLHLNSLILHGDYATIWGPGGWLQWTEKYLGLSDNSGLLVYFNDGGVFSNSNVTATGNVTATAFYGDGSHLTGIGATGSAGDLQWKNDDGWFSGGGPNWNGSNLLSVPGIVSMPAGYDIRFNGTGDANWRMGLFDAFATSIVGASTSLKIVVGQGTEGPDGFAVGQCSGGDYQSIFELSSHNLKAFFRGDVSVNESIVGTTIYGNISQAVKEQGPWVSSGSDVYFQTGRVGIGAAPAANLDITSSADATIRVTRNTGVNLNNLEFSTSSNQISWTDMSCDQWGDVDCFEWNYVPVACETPDWDDYDLNDWTTSDLDTYCGLGLNPPSWNLGTLAYSSDFSIWLNDNGTIEPLVTLYQNGNVNFMGDVTAVSFVGDGSQLTNVGSSGWTLADEMVGTTYAVMIGETPEEYTAAPLTVVTDVSAAVSTQLNLINIGGGTGAGSAIDFYTFLNSTPDARIVAIDDGSYSADLVFLNRALGSPSNALVENFRVSYAGIETTGSVNGGSFYGDGFWINAGGIGSLKAGFVGDNEGGSAPTLDFGLNAAQFGSRNQSYIGSIFRLDSRSGFPYFSLRYQPTGANTEYTSLQIISTGQVLIGTGWDADNNTGTGNGEDLQVFANVSIGGTLQVGNILDSGNNVSVEPTIRHLQTEDGTTIIDWSGDNGAITKLAQITSGYSAIDVFAGFFMHGNNLVMNNDSGAGGGSIFMEAGSLYFDASTCWMVSDGSGGLYLNTSVDAFQFDSSGIFHTYKSGGGINMHGQTLDMDDGNIYNVTGIYTDDGVTPWGGWDGDATSALDMNGYTISLDGGANVITPNFYGNNELAIGDTNYYWVGSYLLIDSYNGSIQCVNANLQVSGQISQNVQSLEDGGDAGTIEWDVNDGAVAAVTLAGSGETLTITNAVAGTVYMLQIVQDGTGGRTITTYTNFKFAGGTVPTLSSAANAIDLMSVVTYDGTNFFGILQAGFA